MKAPLEFMGITQKFRKSKDKKTGEDKHLGIDCGWNKDHGGKNAPIYATEDGVVTYILKQPNSGGNVLWIYNKEHNRATEYGHLEDGSIKVKKNQKIKMGEHIANMGNTGKENGKVLPFHLHLGVQKGKGNNYGILAKWYDPTEFINIYDGQEQGKKTLVKLNHTKRVTAKDGLKIRTKPSLKGKVVRIAKFNEELENHGLKNGWNIVDNELGFYCSNEWLK